MSNPTNPWVALMVLTFRDTRSAAQVLNAMRLNRGILWSMLFLISILTVLTLELSLVFYPADATAPFGSVSPFALTAVVGSALTITVFSLYFAGQMLGGTGRFPAALLVTIWWQAIAIVMQLVQTVALLFSPLLTSLVTLGALVFSIYCLIVFINEMHGFNSLAKALGAVVIAFLGILFGLSLILTLIGVAAQGGAS